MFHFSDSFAEYVVFYWFLEVMFMSMELELLQKQYAEKVHKYKALRERRDALIREGKQWRPAAIALKIAKRDAREAKRELTQYQEKLPSAEIAEIKPIHRVKKLQVEGTTIDLYSHVLKMASLNAQELPRLKKNPMAS